MRTARATYYLVLRALRESVRQPEVELPNLLIPLFFLAVIIGAINQIAPDAFGVTNYTGFQVPVAMAQAVAGVAAVSGIVIVMDIERGYFDKLLLTPAPRVALLLSRLLADAVRSMVISAVILPIGLAIGSPLETGVAGAVVLLLLMGAFGAAYSGIGMAISLRSGNPQAAQLGVLLFFPLLFLSPAFTPIEVFEPWMRAVAEVNPVTYLLGGMRSLILEGWDAAELAYAVAAVAGLGAVTVTLAMLALRFRAR
ncbi:MAG: ABC transporter permease [Chloroflexi bacterium]|nr:ABC transporter permease [Chloroflexota bacterium]